MPKTSTEMRDCKPMGGLQMGMTEGSLRGTESLRFQDQSWVSHPESEKGHVHCPFIREDCRHQSEPIIFKAKPRQPADVKRC